MHRFLDQDSYPPEFSLITQDKVTDIKATLPSHPAPAGPMIGATTTTRCSPTGWSLRVFRHPHKGYLRFEMIEKDAVLQHRHIVRDQTIGLTGPSRIIHEHFCDKYRYVAATRLAPPARWADSSLATSTYCFKYALVSQGSVHPSRMISCRFHHTPALRQEARPTMEVRAVPTTDPVHTGRNVHAFKNGR